LPVGIIEAAEVGIVIEHAQRNDREGEDGGSFVKVSAKAFWSSVIVICAWIRPPSTYPLTAIKSIGPACSL